MVFEAAGASAEPVLTLEGTAKTEAKALLAAGKTRPRPGQRSTVVTNAETRATNYPKEQKGRQSSYVARVCKKRENRRR